jgi:hypothetical protein
MKTQAQLKFRQMVRDGAGKRSKLTVTHTVKSRLAEYNYQYDYYPDTTDAQLAQHMRLLCRQQDERDDKQDEHSPYVGQTIAAAGYTAFIGSINAHIEKPNQCFLILTFWVNERHQWVFHKWEAGTPSQLPTTSDVTAFITAHLTEMSRD